MLLWSKYVGYLIGVVGMNFSFGLYLVETENFFAFDFVVSVSINVRHA